MSARFYTFITYYSCIKSVSSSNMRHLKQLKLIALFYRNFIVLSLIINVVCCRIFWKEGMGSVALLFWFKLITLGLTFYFINNYRYKEYYYYHNLGISKQKLWFYTLSFDFALFILLLICLYPFT